MDTPRMRITKESQLIQCLKSTRCMRRQSQTIQLELPLQLLQLLLKGVVTQNVSTRIM